MRNILLAAVFVLVSASAQADERITLFSSHIAVHKDSSMEVVETINVNAENDQIKHGIYRDFPTTYPDRFGTMMEVGFSVKAVLRDGKSEPYHTQAMSNGVRVYIGDANHFVSPGPHSYVLTYETNRQLGYFKDYDELYWNVTGNGWVFPIYHAEAIVELPPGAALTQQTAYTGGQGSRAQNYSVTKSPDGSIIYTAWNLGPHEGLTIVADWPKGFVSAPGLLARVMYFIEDNKAIALSLLALLGLLGYYGFFWLQVGRDLPAGTIIPLFTPPEGIDAGLAHVIRAMGEDAKTMPVGVVDLAARGYLTISQQKDGLFSSSYVLTKTPHADSVELPGTLKLLAVRLLGSDETLVLHNEEHSKISSAMDGYKEALAQACENTYFCTNRGYVWIGVLGSGAVIGLSWLMAFGQPSIVLIGIWALMGLINLLFWKLMEAPTEEGRKIMDQIEGFKMFLSVTEKDRFEQFHPPAVTPEMFEKYFPFALALGVENHWSEKFARDFGPAAESYQPVWYIGNHHGLSGLSQGLGNGLSSAISSSSVAPGSGGGGFGGGFSGGGGGGGGGGGW